MKARPGFYGIYLFVSDMAATLDVYRRLGLAIEEISEGRGKRALSVLGATLSCLERFLAALGMTDRAGQREAGRT